MKLATDGAQHFPAAITSAELAALLMLLPPPGRSARGGVRLRPSPALRALVEAANHIARCALGADARPAFAKFFDKSAERNWALGWHQDRTIAVHERIDTPGFSAWTLKQDIDHVVPPFAIIQRMLTLRIHLDPAGADNAPLLVAPGSHRLGPIPEAEIPAAVARHGTASCEAAAGDVWLYAAPILHASARAASPRRRRVLQIHYSADRLPGGLEWLSL